MVAYHEGSEVILVREGRILTRYWLDLPAGMLVEQIENGERYFKRFGQGVKLSVVRESERVYVHAGEIGIIRERKAQAPSTSLSSAPPQRYESLSHRQRQVLEGLVRGQTLAEIGFHLGIRTRSVRHHVDALKLKLKAVSLSQLVARAMTENELGSTPPQGDWGGAAK
jgi:DNA-binding CsgD family transcriptional regulator